MSTNDHNRLPPRERLAAAVQRINLNDAAAQLRSEPPAVTSGHRQLAIVRHSPLSILLFVFEGGGGLKEHRTEGVVTIHVLSGELEVDVAGDRTVLIRGELVSLSPGQVHSVYAKVESEILLSVCRTPVE